ncbi:MAG: hypothetical protein AMXMBFR64_39800 [Myxococcales bacterium]
MTPTLPPLDDLMEALREDASRDTWSRGVALARAGAFLQPSTEPDEVVVKLAMQGGAISPTVTLWPADADWACDCASSEDVCQHAVAAVLALRQAQQEGAVVAPPRVETWEVAYLFSRGEGGLHLERELVAGASTRPLEVALSSLVSGRVTGPRVAPTRADLTVEQVLGTKMGGWLNPHQVARVLGLLARHPRVTLDGVPIQLDGTPVTPIVRVDERPGGWEVRALDDPTVTARFPNGAALCGDVLRPVGELELTGRERDELGKGRFFGPHQVDVLAAEVLPSLRARKVPLDVRARRLPAMVRVAPRLEIVASRRGDYLSVVPSIVYGDPPIARVDGGRLTILGDGTRVPVRDEPGEAAISRSIATLLGTGPGRALALGGEEAVAMAARLRDRPEVRAEGLDAFRLAAPLEPRLDLSGGFDLRFEASGARADAGAVLRAWREGHSLAPLLDGGFSPIPTAWLDAHAARLTDLLAAREAAGGDLPRALLPDLARLCQELDVPAPPAFSELRVIVDDFDGVPQAPLPPDLTATLRPYQRRGVDWLTFLRDTGMGALLADDMGLGKTVQALCVLRGRTLVVAPTSVIANWVAEIRRFRPALSAAVYHGPGRRLVPADITVTSYAILRLDADVLAAERWGTVVLDEAQTIKNPDSQVARAAYRLQANHRVALTGTPVENRLDELWSQLHFLNRGLLGGRADFAERYAGPIAAGDAAVALRLRERTRPFVLRRLKRDVAPELPPRTELVLRCELSEAERELYDALHAAAREDVLRELASGASVMRVIELLLRLRQAACHPALVPGQSAERSAKVDLLMESLDVAVGEGHKALVFSQWTSLLDLVEPHLRAAEIPFIRLDGSTMDRGGVVERFQAADGPPVMLVSLRAGGTGLNLTAADNVFLLDPWWNPAVEDQAADRAHRIGQDRPVFVHRLIAQDTVEERILALQQTKRELADVALGDARLGAALTREDLLALLD